MSRARGGALPRGRARHARSCCSRPAACATSSRASRRCGACCDHDSDLIARHREQTRALERRARARRRRPNARRERGRGDAARGAPTSSTRSARASASLASQLGASRARARARSTELEIAGRALEETVAAWRGGAAPAAGRAAARAPAVRRAARAASPDPVHGALLRELRPRARRRLPHRDVPQGRRPGRRPWERPCYAVAAGRVRYAGGSAATATS